MKFETEATLVGAALIVAYLAEKQYTSSKGNGTGLTAFIEDTFVGQNAASNAGSTGNGGLSGITGLPNDTQIAGTANSTGGSAWSQSIYPQLVSEYGLVSGSLPATAWTDVAAAQAAYGTQTPTLQQIVLQRSIREDDF